MCQSMFDRLLALFMAVILLMALISAGFSVFSIRGAMVDSRMEGLLVQAREIAYLAANLDSSSVWTTDESTMNYLQWKARNVYEDYGAYILIVDRSGHVMDNMQAALQDSTGDMLQSLNSEELSQLMLDVLKGKGPADLTEVCLQLAANMLVLAGKGTPAECRAMAQAADPHQCAGH